MKKAIVQIEYEFEFNNIQDNKIIEYLNTELPKHYKQDSFKVVKIINEEK